MKITTKGNLFAWNLSSMRKKTPKPKQNNLKQTSKCLVTMYLGENYFALSQNITCIL